MLPAHTLIHIDSAQPLHVPARKWFVCKGLTSCDLRLLRPGGFFLLHADFAAPLWTGLPGGLK